MNLRILLFSASSFSASHAPQKCQTEEQCFPRLSTVAHTCHGKSINLMAKRKRLTAKRITSGCGKKQKTHSKKKNLVAKRKRLKPKRKRLTTKFLRYREDIFILIYFAVRSWLFFLLWGYSFCHEVLLFAVRLILLSWQLWATVPFKFCSQRFLIFQHVGISEN